MKPPAIFAIIASTIALANPIIRQQEPLTTERIPSLHESAVLARRILRLSSVGILSTNLPSSSSHSAGWPIGLSDYIADCDPYSPGSPTVLAMTIATSFRNVAAGSNISLSLRWEPPENAKAKYSVASLPRFSILATLEEISAKEVKEGKITRCYTKTHPDAKWWTPGNRIHESRWARLVPNSIYWVGGFGDRAFIGWFTIDEWQTVTEDEIETARLPGEV